MARREFTLTRDPEALARLVRILDASVNVEVLSALVTARKETRTGGWVFLSDLAKRVGQAPGTVSVAVQRMVPQLVEEKYDRGRRYFRARVSGVSIVVDEAT